MFGQHPRCNIAELGKRGARPASRHGRRRPAVEVRSGCFNTVNDVPCIPAGGLGRIRHNHCTEGLSQACRVPRSHVHAGGDRNLRRRGN